MGRKKLEEGHETVLIALLVPEWMKAELERLYAHRPSLSEAVRSILQKDLLRLRALERAGLKPRKGAKA